jgi:hypothetical protein
MEMIITSLMVIHPRVFCGFYEKGWNFPDRKTLARKGSADLAQFFLTGKSFAAA